MKFSIKPQHLKYLILGAGGLGLVLRIVLYATGTDEKGLLVTGHWARIGLWILTALTAAVIILFTKPIEGPGNYRDCYPVSYAAGLGSFAAAAGILITTISEMSALASTIELVLRLFGFGAAAAFVLIGLGRLMGTKSHFLLHAVICGYFGLRMVWQYQQWSSDPQLLDYCFYLTAYVALMLTAYQHAAFDADMGSHRQLWLLTLIAVYLCCLSLKGTQDTLLMLVCGIWAFTNLTSLTVRPRRQRPTLILDEDTPEKG